VDAVVFSLDGKQLASVSWKTALLWDTATSDMLETLKDAISGGSLYTKLDTQTSRHRRSPIPNQNMFDAGVADLGVNSPITDYPQTGAESPPPRPIFSDIPYAVVFVDTIYRLGVFFLDSLKHQSNLDV